jgi:polyferredoxin
MLEAWIGAVCPLTVLENALRAKSGVTAYARSFIGHWLARLIFSSAPEWIFTLVYTSFTVVVVLTWLAYPPRNN